ncbi:MAG TPA: hypothetical protein VK249_11475 [Anaerolineales bacterium]|nr:hypothetical protein [Anaerolineales bacterium]
MKTILRIIDILLVASIVAGAFSLAMSRSLIASDSNEGGQTSFTSSTDQSITQPMVRPEGGDRTDGSITRGFAGVLGTLAKLAGIIALVLLIQRGFRQIAKPRLTSTQP